MQILAATFLRASLSTTPMPVIFDTAEPGLRAWWRDGDLLVAPAEGDERPGLRPLTGRAPVVIPDKMEGWQPIGPGCSGDPSPFFELEGVRMRAHWQASEAPAPGTSTPETLSAVSVTMGETIVAVATLGRPVKPCALVAANLDPLPGLELVVLWEVDGNKSTATGLTVFRIPPPLVP